jgi:predicted P-loop ATPase
LMVPMPRVIAMFDASSSNWSGKQSRIKPFMSRTNDRFQRPYGRRLIESPRQCMFAGTVNHSSYPAHDTGG